MCHKFLLFDSMCIAAPISNPAGSRGGVRGIGTLLQQILRRFDYPREVFLLNGLHQNPEVGHKQSSDESVHRHAEDHCRAEFDAAFAISQFWRAISMRCSAMDMLNEFVSPSLTSRVSTRSSNPSHHLSSEGRVVQCPETQSNFINSQPFQTKTAFCHVRFECRGYKNKCHAKLHGIYFYSLRPDQMWGPAATRALPASLVSNFLKLLMNISASFLALSSHSLASA